MQKGLHAVYEIRTPENVAFRFELAGLASRGLAWTIDLAAMLLLMQLSAMLGSLVGWVIGAFANALMMLAFFLVQWWYAAVAEWRFSGRTLGKWLLGIRAIDGTGLPLTFLQASVRNLLRIVDFLPGLYLVGGACALLDAHGRRLGDLAAGTLVVRERRAPLRGRVLANLTAEATAGASLPGLREAAAHLSQSEHDAVMALCAERDRLPLGVRLESFARLSSHLEARHALERPAHMSAEKLVLALCAASMIRASRR